MLGVKIETAIRVYERLGLPEGELPIAFSIIEAAKSPKSNSVVQARDNVKEFIDDGKIYQIPKHLKDAHYASAKKIGDGIGYNYPHNFYKNWVNQEYLPKEIKNTKFYEPGNNKIEQEIQKYWDNLKENWFKVNKKEK